MLTNKAVRHIRKYKKTPTQSEFAGGLLKSAEQRINRVYMLLMIAVEAAILIYVFVNTWDDTRFYFCGIAGGFALTGIILNLILNKTNYPWLKYVNNLVIMVVIFTLNNMTDLMALLFVLVPLINSFYMRPKFTALTGVVSLAMLYISFMNVLVTVYDVDGNVDINLVDYFSAAFDYNNEFTVTLVQSRSFLMIVAAALVVVSVYLSASSRNFTIRQADLMNKTISTEMELNVARDIQEGILSAEFPDNASYAVYADMTPATEVGGDFYDYFLIDETHLAIVVGDVSGHGMAAAMFMTLTKTLMKVYAQSHYSAEKVFEQTNRYLQQSNPAKFFVTGWMGIVDLTTGVLTYANAGHNYPVLVRNGKSPAFLRSKPNFVLGRRRLVRYQENRTKLRPGDKLVLYTDGVTEAQSPDESFFGDDRLLSVIDAAKEQNQQEMIVSLRAAIDAFENGSEHHDDATALALSFKNYLQVAPPERKSFFLSVKTFDSVTEYVARQCTAAGCDETTVGQITIAVSEILANIDLYAYENGGEIEVLTKCRDRRMTIAFKDNGKPFNPLLVKEPDVTLSLDNRKPGGLGIFIVKKLMSEISYSFENNQNVLTIEKDF